MKLFNSQVQHTLFNLLIHLQKKPKQEQGYIIVVVMGMILALSTMLVTAALTSKVDTNTTRASRNTAAGFYAAEAGLNLRAQDIRTSFEGYNLPGSHGMDYSPASSTACRAANVLTPAPINKYTWGLGDFICKNSGTFQGQSVWTFIADANKVPGGNGVEPVPNEIQITDGGDFDGLSAQEYRYDVTSVAFDSQDQPTASLQMRFKSRLVPLFQFAAFYQNDLDITRPAAMTINGPVHTNGNIYLNASANVTINGRITAAGQMFRGEKNPDETCNSSNSSGTSGVLKIKNPKTNAGLVMNCNGSPRGEITQGTDRTDIYVGGSYANNWGGGINSLGKQLTIPSTSFTDPKLPTSSQSYDYWNKADLRIALRLTNDSSESPVSIEVVNTDKSINSAATAVLNGSTCLPASTTTTLAGTSYSTASNSITVANASNFSSGTPLRIAGTGIDDFDENVISSKSSNTLTLKRPLGKQNISSPTGVTVSKAIVWSSKTFFNYREKTLDSSSKTIDKQGRLIRMLNMDMKGLMDCASALMNKPLNDSTEGGLVWYFTVIGPNSDVDTTKTSPDSPNSYGIRLYNGAVLGSGSTRIQGLTVVSDQAVYVRGDYNTGDTNTPQTITKRPAAILADSINILSNNSPLDDSTSCTSYDNIYNATDCIGSVKFSASNKSPTTRVASDTTINAAFLSGVDIPGSASGQSGGGLNNYPRLHEDWRGSIFTYKGSMVSLGEARRVNGPFGGVGLNWNIYYAPTRNWDYDTDFNQAQNLPPLTPRFVYLQQERFSRDFNRSAFLSLPNFMVSSASNTFLSVVPSFRSISFSF